MPPKGSAKASKGVPTTANGTEASESIQPSSDRPWTESLTSIFGSKDFRTASFLIILAAVYSPVSLQSLSPVYGGVPSQLFHRHGMMACALLAFVARFKFQHIFNKDISPFLPAIAFSIPTIQYFLFQQSSLLGNPYGPVITEALTYFPLVAVTIYSSAALLQQVDLSGHGEMFEEAAPTVWSYLLFSVVEKFSKAFIGMNIGKNFLTSRIGLQLSTAALYGLVLPSAPIWPSIPSVAFTLGYNIHTPLSRTTARMNDTLTPYNFTLVERKESLTGYISILQNTHQNYRVMRCDHSLLGGEWTSMKPRGTPSVAEPIYAIFTMLEAVRLIEPDDGGSRRPDAGSSALTIGLGIGTTPGAFIMHGIDTTIVEIDPVVYDFAQRYFNLPSNHTPVIGNALSFVEQAREEGNKKYDYIVHDVFTGGAEPVDLFTIEFLSGLRALLKEDGVIAINYAGDLATPSARIIILTIRSVFPTCRVFRENPPPPPPPSPSSPGGAPEEDFTNMVIFCKSNKKTPLTFRAPKKEDYLYSRAREAFMLPRFEIPESAFEGGKEDVESLILRKGQTKHLEKLQMKSAVGHWALMRTVIDTKIWENW